MTKRTATRTARKAAEPKPPSLPWQDKRWFEVVTYFDPDKIEAVHLSDIKRMFVLGEIENTLILEVPRFAPQAMVEQALEALGERGIRALAFTDNIKFVRLRMCSDAECGLLDEHNKGTGVVYAQGSPQSGSGVQVARVVDRGPGLEAGDGSAVVDGSDPNGQERQEARGEESG